jgi:hypothetical protein
MMAAPDKDKVLERIEGALPTALQVFFDSLPWEDKRQMIKVSPQFIAKVYQAGAVFALNMTYPEVEK